MALLIGSVFEHAARTTPDAIAATLDDRSLTFGEIDAAANRIACGLLEAGVGRGDRILWWGDTSLEAIPIFAALAKIGAVFAPLNARASMAELVPVAQYARARLLLAGASHLDAGRDLARDAGVEFLAKIELGSMTPPKVDVAEDDTHVIFFTSGS